MKHMLANRIIIIATLLALTFSAGGAAPVEAAGMYTHTWFVERSIQRLGAYGDYSELVRILNIYPGIVNYGAIFPDITFGNVDNEWAETLHDTGAANGNYTKYLQYLVDKGYDKYDDDLQTGYYKAFLEDPNYTAVIPMFRASLVGQLVGRYRNIPRSADDEKMIAFLFGVIAHQEADVSWHWRDPNWLGLEQKAINDGLSTCGFLIGELNQAESCLDVVLLNYDKFNNNPISMDYLSTIKPIVFASSDAAGIPRPQCKGRITDVVPWICSSPSNDPLADGQNQIGWLRALQVTNPFYNDDWKNFVQTYVPGGIEYGSAFVAGAWMQTWDRLNNTAIYHVKPAASGNQNCSSWDNACTLQSALSQAVNGEIWAAKGIYRPTEDDTNRSAYFRLMPTVSVYGGFAGTETTRDQRNPATNLTILSGDIDLNDSQTPVITDLSTVTGNTTNSYHVVTGANTAILDGFTITGGYAGNGSSCPSDACGGGMFNGATSPTVTNVTFSGNFASAAGGGMYNDHSNPTLTDVTFQSNTAKFGGGIENYVSSPVLTNAIFANNTATTGNGGGMHNDRSNPTLTNVTFQSNTANYGGGIENYVSSPVLTNTTFVNNTATTGNGGGMHNASQTICNPYGAGSDCHIEFGSPALTNITFSGNTAKFGGGLDNDISSPMLTNVTFNGNTATVGGGSMHNKSQYTCMHWFASLCTGRDWYVSAPVVRNSLSWGNGSGEMFNEIYKEADGTPPSRTQISNSVVQGGCPSEATCTNLITTDPKLGTLGSHGGFTQTIPLLAGSSAIDAGNDDYCPDTDQRGASRPQGSHCDIGAYEYQPDTTPPTVLSITRMDANPANTTSVRFSVIFSEAVTGVNTAVPFSDFALTSSGVLGASITSVSGSGTAYTVTVNTGSGKGTIRMDGVDDDSIRDGNNNPLGGAGTGNGNYTSGEGYTITAGADATGVFRPDNGLLYLKNKNDTGFADYALNYGLPGDYPVVGDWDGNGTVTIGIYRGKTFYLRNENTLGFATIVFDFGQVGDQPIAGDWNGDGVDTIGVFRPSTGQFQLRNSNDAGPAEMSFYLGNVGDVGVAGDWNGDGVDTTGVFRPSNGIIFLKDTNDTGIADYALNYGLPGDKPVMGDWDNDGIDTIGIYRNGTFYLRNENTNGFATIVFSLGNPGDHPIAGNWDGLP